MDEIDKYLLRRNKKIALIRPGGIGDIIAIINILPEFCKLYFDYRIDFFTFSTELAPLLQATGIFNVYDLEQYPSIAEKYQEVYWLAGHPLNIEEQHQSLDPKISHYIDYTINELCLDHINWKLLPKIDFNYPKIANSTDYITIHPFTGGSIYREWFFDRWQQVIDAFPNEHFIQIGVETNKRFNNCDISYLGRPLMDSIALIANAKLHIGIDSFSNHTTYLTKTPGIILWGATSPTIGGYDQNTNIYLNLSCSPCFRENPLTEAILEDNKIREFVKNIKVPYSPCFNPPNQTHDNPQHFCMTGITSQIVIEAIKDKLATI